MVTIYYHDPVEVDPDVSWTGLRRTLAEADRRDIREVTDPDITRLFDYARPDAVVTLNGEPVVSIEQTSMNPSGHNIPQRFSFHVRAAELGVASILYYPEYSRRTYSDPNPRYLNVRVPLAQQRLSEIYDVPALSVFWPTDDETLLPSTRQDDHQQLADLVAALIEAKEYRRRLMDLPEVDDAFRGMIEVVDAYHARYRSNDSVRQYFEHGFDSARVAGDKAVDPPGKATLYRTRSFVESTDELQGSLSNLRNRGFFDRDYTLLFEATTNSAGNDSEHPWPGYFALLDILYAREADGTDASYRRLNMVYHLPAPFETFKERINADPSPTAAYIVDSFADVILLDGGAVLGRVLRGEGIATGIASE